MGNPAACILCMGAELSKPIAYISWPLVSFIMYTHGAPETGGMILGNFVLRCGNRHK